MDLIIQSKGVIKNVSFWSGVTFSSLFLGTLIASFIFRDKVAIKIKEEAPQKESLDFSDDLLTEPPSVLSEDLSSQDTFKVTSSTTSSPSIERFSLKELDAEEPVKPSVGLFTNRPLSESSPTGGGTSERLKGVFDLSSEDTSTPSAPTSTSVNKSASTSPPSIPIDFDLDEKPSKPPEDDLFISDTSDKRKRKPPKSKDDFLSLDF